MICADMPALLGFTCYPLNDDGTVALISSPFKFQDGAALPIYVEKIGTSVRFFDDAGVVLHFLGRGLGDLDGGLRTGFIKKTLQPYGLTLNDEGVIEVLASEQQAQQAFAQYLSGLFAIVGWEHENQGVSEEASYFVDEVALCLHAWKPYSNIARNQPYLGMTKIKYDIDFVVDGEAVIAISPHPVAVGAALKKMVDIAGVDPTIRFRVVLEDRVNPVLADTQGVILSAMATVMPMTKLVHAAGATATANS